MQKKNYFKYELDRFFKIQESIYLGKIKFVGDLIKRKTTPIEAMEVAQSLCEQYIVAHHCFEESAKEAEFQISADLDLLVFAKGQFAASIELSEILHESYKNTQMFGVISSYCESLRDKCRTEFEYRNKLVDLI